MTNKELEKFTQELPEIIDISIDMCEPNMPIEIYTGEFTLKNKEIEVTAIGNIRFDWFPQFGSYFYGKSINPIEPFYFSNLPNDWEVIINGRTFGKGFALDISTESSINGIIQQGAFFGDQSIIVEKIKFHVPNLREFHGLPVKKIEDNSLKVSRNRLTFENEIFTIILDQCHNYDERKKRLKEKGGYTILYAGELIKKKGAIAYKDIKEIFDCLNFFLSFLNGRRISALFLQGIYEDKVIWCDYKTYHNDIYKPVLSWPERGSILGFNELWQKFSTLWKNKEDKNFLTTLIHWYVEANGHSGFSEGSIIMAQTALELLYNWWIIEKKKIIHGKDAENISAANKIRLLISQLDIGYSIPLAFSNLQKFKNTTENVIDGPDSIVFIRNAIVHSQEEKRKKLNSIHYLVKYEALQLSIWYIEISLLCILGFEGKYYNRCTEGNFKFEAEESVPWAKINKL